MIAHRPKTCRKSFCKALHALSAEFLLAFAVMLFLVQPFAAQAAPLLAVICGAEGVSVVVANDDQDLPCPECARCALCLAAAEQPSLMPPEDAMNSQAFVSARATQTFHQSTKIPALIHKQMVRGPPASICDAHRVKVFS